MNDINFDYEKTSIEQTIDKIEKIKIMIRFIIFSF